MARKNVGLETLEARCAALASEQGLELCDVAMEHENTGEYLRIYLDKDGGLTLDDCERFHRAALPLAEGVEYDFLEVCSPGIDRPIKTERDVGKALGMMVEVRLYKPIDGVKSAQGILKRMDKETVELQTEGAALSYPRKGVALVKLVPDLSALDGE